ncbi:3D domain-containing protein [Niallia sp. 03190]
MRSLKKMMVIALTSMFFLSTAIMAQAETNQESLKKNQRVMDEKVAEQQKVLKELEAVHKDLANFNNELEKNKKSIAALKQDIANSQKRIEEKKKDIVKLEDKVLSRKKIMKDRLVSLQHNNQTNVVIEVLVNAKNLSDFLDRATAVTVIYNMDKEILEQQKTDLEEMEKEKQEIAEEEKELQKQFQSLAANQVNLEKNLQQKQEALASVQKKYKTISNEVNLAKKEKEAIQLEINQQQDDLKKEQQEAKTNKKTFTQQKQTIKKAAAVSNTKKDNESGEEIYVTATAYSHESVSSEFTAVGINIKKNPNMKLIAVDPSVIPLGTKVWVEGYGEAIAGDTGGAINGHKIDVLMPSNSKARSWGRQTVKVVILD